MKKIIAIVLTTLILSACGSASPEEKFISDMREEGYVTSDFSDEKVLSLGQDVCELIDRYGEGEAYRILTQEIGVFNWTAAGTMRLSQEHLCPK